MPFEPGRSGNPAGRPKKGRALADLLQAALNEPYYYNGHLINRGAIMAALLAEAVSTGRLTFPEDPQTHQQRRHELSVDHWIKLVTLLLGHVDGPPAPDTTDRTADLDAVLDWVMDRVNPALPAPTSLSPPAE